jgi:hypothetical protein
LYDAILNPLFDVEKRFKLRQLGANLQTAGLIMFIFAMLLAISAVSSIATILSAAVCCIVMTIYIEARLVDATLAESKLQQILDPIEKDDKSHEQ